MVMAKGGTNEKNSPMNEKNSPIGLYSAPFGGTAPGDFVRFNVGHCSLTIGKGWCLPVISSIVSAYSVIWSSRG